MSDEHLGVVSWRGFMLSTLLPLVAACSAAHLPESGSSSQTPAPPLTPPQVATLPATGELPSDNYVGWIAFVADLDGERDLYLENPSTLEARAFGLGGLPVGFPAWSPDWSHIAFVGPEGVIFILDVSCLGRGSCQEEVQDYPVEFATYSTISWLPSGEGLVFASLPAVEGEPSQLVTLFMSGETTSVRLAEGVGANPDVHPDGTCVLLDSSIGLDQLMVFDLLTGFLRPFVGVAGLLPNSSDGDWSPDGTQVAFETTFGTGLNWGRFDIVVADADGSNPRVLVENGMHPDWSPDGGAVVFERDDGLYVVDIDSREERKILDLPLVHLAPMPAWSP